MSAGCLVCGAEGCRGHHPTGRGTDGRYLDPRFTIPACHDDHALYHDDWRTLGIDDCQLSGAEPAGLAFLDRIELRLRRMAVCVGRLAEVHPEWPWIAQLARALKGWADDLALHLAAQDRRDPGWRTDLGFYPTPG